MLKIQQELIYNKTNSFFNIFNLKYLLYFLIFRFILDVVYVNIISRVYSYANFHYHFSLENILISYFFTILIFPFIPLKSNKISDFINQYLIIMIYIPSSSYFAYSNASLYWFFSLNLFWIIILSLCKLNISLKLPDFKFNFNRLVIVFYVLAVIVLFIILYSIGLTYNFDIKDVYSQREIYKNANIPLSGYIVNWIGKIILPFLLLYSLYNIKDKKYLLMFLFTLLLIFSYYSVTGHKSYLFFIPMGIGAYILLKSKNIFKSMLIIFFLMIVSCVIMYSFLDFKLPLSLIVRRTLFIPAQVSTFYFEYFNDNFIYLSNSVLSGLYEYPLADHPAKLIGVEYFNDDVIYVNNGIFSDGYINFGVIGIIAWAILFVFLLKIVDFITEGKNKLILWPFLLMSFNSVVNGALFTSILTHGLFLSLIICFLFPKSNNLNNNPSKNLKNSD